MTIKHDLRLRGDTESESDCRTTAIFDEDALQNMREERKQAAIGYAEQGFRVVRLHGVSPDEAGKLVCDCGNPKCGNQSGKHPNISIKLHSGPIPSPDTVRRWWEEKPNSNVGLSTADDEFIVIDVDLPREPGDPDGRASWRYLTEIHGEPPKTLTAQSGSGGFHYWFSAPDGCTSKDPLVVENHDKIDLKRGNAYLAVPPSLHRSGNTYRWIQESVVAPLPKSFFIVSSDLKGPVSRAVSATTRSSVPSEVADLYLAELRQKVDPAKKIEGWLKENLRRNTAGERSNELYELCLYAGTNGIDPERLFLALINPNNEAGEKVRGKIKQMGKDKGKSWFYQYNYEPALLELAGRLAHIDQLIRAAKEHDWKTEKVGVRPEKLQLVILESLYILRSRVAFKTMVSKSIISQSTKIERKTVLKAMRALEDLGWIFEHETKAWNATTYRLPDISPIDIKNLS